MQNSGVGILNAVLNNDVDELLVRIISEPQNVNIVGKCGESPLHISIYKRNLNMISLLLERGKASSSICNNKGEPAYYSAVKIGWYLGFKTCYDLDTDNNNCNLNFIDSNQKSIYDIACSLPSDEDVRLTQLYGYWDSNSSTLIEERKRMIEGRLKCAAFLRKQIPLEIELNCKRLTVEATQLFNRKMKFSHILNGPKEMDYVVVYNSKILFPRTTHDKCWSQEERNDFFGNERSVKEVCIKNFSNSFINQSVYNAVENTRIKHQSNTK